MSRASERRPIDSWAGQAIPAGETRNVVLAVGESYSSRTVEVPVQIRRAEEPGPVVFISGALHGDEINGTGTIRQLIQDEEFVLRRGAVILIPVLNLLAFERHSRYLPDRRDLNRAFPGSSSGSLASRMATVIFEEIVARCDYGVDLHTAAVRRTNYPNIRGDLTDASARQVAEAFGCEILINSVGPSGSLRREACKAGCPTILMEGGEVWKVEPGIVESTTRGIKNVLRSLEMLDGEIEPPPYQLVIEKSKWIRAERGGFLQFHIAPGDIIEKDQPLATNTTLLGHEHSVLHAPFDAVVIGMTTLPAISPGEPVCNLGRLPRGTRPVELRSLRSEDSGLEERISSELASSVHVVDP